MWVQYQIEDGIITGTNNVKVEDSILEGLGRAQLETDLDFVDGMMVKDTQLVLIEEV